MMSNYEHNNKPKNNNSVDLFIAITTDNYMNSSNTSINGYNYIKINRLVKKTNENVEITNLNLQKVEVNSILIKYATKNRYQLQS